MSANAVIDFANAVGIQIYLDGEELDVQFAPSLHLDGDELDVQFTPSPPAAVIAVLKRYKPEIIAALRQESAAWTCQDWQAFFNERAAILEHEGGLDRAEAERQAYIECQQEWFRRNPIQARKCCFCGEEGRPDEPVELQDVHCADRMWLHRSCHQPLVAFRAAKAHLALAEMGLFAPVPPGSTATRVVAASGECADDMEPLIDTFD